MGGGAAHIAIAGLIGAGKTTFAGALALVASHSRDLSALEGQLPGFHNFHGSDDLATKYQILPGPSRQKNALDVLEEEGLPAELIREARRLLQQP
jgi:DNA mismatch repair ATPase MutS